MTSADILTYRKLRVLVGELLASQVASAPPSADLFSDAAKTSELVGRLHQILT